MKAELSVIIPVFKMGNYLKSAVDSVLCQTLREIQVFLVDDGSPDESAAICDQYAAADPRVVVLHRQNGGLSAARNTALDLLDTPYVTFLDGDDCIAEARAYEYILGQMKQNNADMALYGYRRFSDGETPEIATGEIVPQQVLLFDKSQLIEWLYENVSASHPLIVWNKMYRSSLFQNARFEEGNLVEDSRIIPDLYRAANRFVRISHPMILYRMRPGSQSNYRSPKLCCDHALSTMGIYEFAKETGHVGYRRETAIRWAKGFFTDYYTVLFETKKNETNEEKSYRNFIAATMRTYFARMYPELVQNANLSSKQRFCCSLFRKFPRVATKLAKRWNAFDFS